MYGRGSPESGLGRGGVVAQEDCPQKVRQLLLAYAKIFQESLEPVKGYRFALEMKDDAPFQQKQYPVPQAYKTQVREAIREMEEKGVVERSITPYVSPLVVVIKKNGKVSICLDTRKQKAVNIPQYEAPPLAKLYTSSWKRRRIKRRPKGISVGGRITWAT